MGFLSADGNIEAYYQLIDENLNIMGNDFGSSVYFASDEAVEQRYKPGRGDSREKSSLQVRGPVPVAWRPLGLHQFNPVYLAGTAGGVSLGEFITGTWRF